MTWTEALEIVVGRTRHERFRVLTADDHPDHEIWRGRMLEMAGQDPPPVIHYPPVATQAVNLWQSVRAFVASGGKLANKKERARRLAICHVCPFYDSVQTRCTKCGCMQGIKVFAAALKCPDDPPRW